jgi:hypothetical protein
MEQSFLAPGHSLPVGCRIVERMRDVVILDLPSADTKPSPTFTRTAVVLDKMADPRIFNILFALHYQNRAIRMHLVGLAKIRGVLRWWYADQDTFDDARRALIKACHDALWPYDRIDTEPGILVDSLADGTAGLERLAADDLLRAAVPQRYRLGPVVHS